MLELVQSAKDGRSSIFLGDGQQQRERSYGKKRGKGFGAGGVVAGERGGSRERVSVGLNGDYK